MVNVWSVLFDGEGGVLKIEAEVRGVESRSLFPSLEISVLRVGRMVLKYDSVWC